MKKDIPAWALRRVTPEEYGGVRYAQGQGRLQIQWPDLNALRDWAKRQGWPTPWFGFQDAFLTKMLENQENFQRGIAESGIEMRIPQPEFTISIEKLAELDALYAERSDSGRPTGWGVLVEELREIRRAVEAGVVVMVDDGPALRSWQGFYGWAHGRYHMLEDGYDSWIGDDAS